MHNKELLSNNASRKTHLNEAGYFISKKYIITWLLCNLKNLENLEKSGNLIFDQKNQGKVGEFQHFIHNSGKVRDFENFRT